MASCWANRRFPAGQIFPPKVQAQTIKNNGKEPIYLFGIEDDMPIPTATMKAFWLAIVDPGCEVYLSFNSHFNNPISYPDYDVTIHSDGAIDVDIESSDICDRWNFDSSHPWNGGCLPNGHFTKRHTPPKGVLAVGNTGGSGTGGGGSGFTGGGGSANSGGSGMGTPIVFPSSKGITLPAVLSSRPPPPPVGSLGMPLSWIEVNITIPAGPKCTCGERKLRNPGKCSYWCDLEVDKNKQIV